MDDEGQHARVFPNGRCACETCFAVAAQNVKILTTSGINQFDLFEPQVRQVMTGSGHLTPKQHAATIILLATFWELLLTQGHPAPEIPDDVLAKLAEAVEFMGPMTGVGQTKE